jgi:hypothetical protein
MKASADSKVNDFAWQSMSIDRFATFHAELGIKVCREGGIWWRQVRPFFYRPLLPLNKYTFHARRQGLARFAVFQHAVEKGCPHNSFLNPIVFDRLPEYEMKELAENARRNLKKAFTSGVTVARIFDKNYFAEHAYAVYLSFYERTKYSFDTSRRTRDGFARWTEKLFAFPENTVLGAFLSGKLIGLEITCLVDNILVIETVMHSNESLRLGAPDLMLHHWRTSARNQPEIHMILDSMLTEKEGVNEFKLRRGAIVLALPACLHLAPAALHLLKVCNKRIYQKLHGLSNYEVPTYKTGFASDSDIARSA